MKTMKILTTSSLINEENYRQLKICWWWAFTGPSNIHIIEKNTGTREQKKIVTKKISRPLFVRSMKIRRIYDDTDSESYGNNESGQ